MNNAGFNKKQVIRYLLWTFAVAYAVQFGAAYLYNRVNLLIGQLVIAASMAAPTLGALFSGVSLKKMGWKLPVRQNVGTILTAWFAPAVLTALGAGLYFLFFPGHFDVTGAYVSASAGPEALRQMEEQGLTYPAYLLISAVSAVVYAPVINTFLALGEEIGWRGFLYPQLKARFGRRKGWLLGGVIWGAWHWPLIWLIGYEYGAAAGNKAGYFGFPVVGMLLFCAVTPAWGILHDRLYEKSGSIWVPALFHGAINAAASLPLAVCLTDTGSARLLGPAPMGVLAGLPFFAAAAAVFLRAKNDKPAEEHPPEAE